MYIHKYNNFKMTNYDKKLIIIFPSILISILPLLLITGPFLSDLSVILINIFFLVNIYITKNYKVFNNIFFKIFFIFFLYLIFNSLIKYYNFDNIRISFSYIRFGLLVLAVIYFLERNEKILDWLFFCLILCFSTLIVDGFYQYFFGENLTGFSLGHERRVSSFFYTEYILGSYLSRLAPVFLGLVFLFSEKKKNNLILLFILFIIVQILIFLSGERAAFFFSLMTTFFIIIMIQGFKKFRILVIFLPIIFIFLITSYNDKAKKRIIDETIAQIGINSKERNIFSSHHESHYKSAYKMFIDNKLFGVGIRNFRNFCNTKEFKINEKSCDTHPHNTYIQLLSETGILGFLFGIIFFIFFSYKTLVHLIKKYFKRKIYFNNFEICILAAILTSIWPLIPTGNFFNNWLSIIYYFPVGFLLWSLKKKNK